MYSKLKKNEGKGSVEKLKKREKGKWTRGREIKEASIGGQRDKQIDRQT